MIHLHTCLGTTQISVCLVHVQDSSGSAAGQVGVASQVLRFRVRLQLSQSRCLSLILVMSSRTHLFSPPRGHKPPNLRYIINLHLCLQRPRFLFPRYAKRQDVTLNVIGPFFFPPRLLRTAPSRFPNMIRFGNRPPLIRISAPHPQKYLHA